MKSITSNTKQTINSNTITAIPDLSIDFTPKHSNSKILLRTNVFSNGRFVSAYGFLEGSNHVYTSNDGQQEQTGVRDGSMISLYERNSTTLNRTYNQSIEIMVDANNTSQRTYHVGACCSYNNNPLALIINDRNGDNMRGCSTFTIFEIAQ